jgi:hypothetical protein
MTRLLAGMAGVAALLSAGAYADTRTMKGSGLSLTLTTEENTTIETDPGLSGAVRVVADAVDCLDAPEEGAGPGGGPVHISTASCGSDAGELTIMVPANFPVNVTVAGSGNVKAGDLMGPLHATLTSDGDLAVRHAGPVQLFIRGSGDVTLTSVDGPATIDVAGSGTVKLLRLNGPLQYTQHGSGDLAVAHIEAPSAQVDSAGSGDAVIAGGHVGALRVRLAGSGDFAMSGTLDSADLQAAGGGDIRVPRPSGQVVRHAAGGSTISVGGSAGLASSAMQRLASSVSHDSDDDDDSDSVTVSSGHHHGGFVHFVAGVVVLGILIAVWRTVTRNGGPSALRGRFAASGPAPAPTHPGVIALCDLLAGLERRLARVETHVTSKEFDLDRKFREIDAGGAGPR